MLTRVRASHPLACATPVHILRACYGTADVHAKDVVYHNSCYKDYTSLKRLELLMKKQLDAETMDSPHKQAFERLAQDVEKDILREIPNVMSLSSLCSTYQNYLDEPGTSATDCHSTARRNVIKLNMFLAVLHYRVFF